MERFTKPCTGQPDANRIEAGRLTPTENGYVGEAADRLARLESLYEQLTARQEKLAEELASLRLAGKTRTTKFQQLMAKKLTDKNVIILLDTYVFDSISDRAESI